MKRNLMRNMARAARVLAMTAVFGGLAAIGGADCLAAGADTVVYGKIYTSNANHDYAEAFAVKDGKYVYVGDAAGAAPYIEKGVTNVIDRSNKGLIMAGATEGHGHYMVTSSFVTKNILMSAETKDEIVAYLKDRVAKEPDANMYVSYGWDNTKLKEVKEQLNMREALDEVCSDKVVFMYDNSGHNAFLNSKALQMAGITSDTVIEGGVISKDADGNLLGLVSDIALNYALSRTVATMEFVTPEEFAQSIEVAQDMLHANGYTSVFDGMTSPLGESVYSGLAEYDKAKGLTVNVSASLKIDPFDNVDKSIQKAIEYKGKYTTTHMQSRNIKLFADGECVESKSGWVINPYKDGTYGTQVWPTPIMDRIVQMANVNGISVHVHASGDAATRQAVEAFVKAEPAVRASGQEVINGIAHSRQITDAVKDLMARHNIYSATNIAWRGYRDSQKPYINANFDKDFYNAGYPIKSLLDRGIVVTSSTDYPANSGSPCDVPSIMEIAVNGTVDPNLVKGDNLNSLDLGECITVEQAMDVFTINGARQMGLQDERGSIENGKYADFILLDKDVTAIAKNQIHTAKVEKVYFEGKDVYDADNASAKA